MVIKNFLYMLHSGQVSQAEIERGLWASACISPTPPTPFRLPPSAPRSARRSISFRLLLPIQGRGAGERGEGREREREQDGSRGNARPEINIIHVDVFKNVQQQFFLFNNIYNMVVRSTLAGDEQTIIFLEKSVQLTTVETRKINIKKIWLKRILYATTENSKGENIEPGIQHYQTRERGRKRETYIEKRKNKAEKV